jgi:hypothetical protein
MCTGELLSERSDIRLQFTIIQVDMAREQARNVMANLAGVTIPTIAIIGELQAQRQAILDSLNFTPLHEIVQQKEDTWQALERDIEAPAREDQLAPLRFVLNAPQYVGLLATSCDTRMVRTSSWIADSNGVEKSYTMRTMSPSGAWHTHLTASRSSSYCSQHCRTLDVSSGFAMLLFNLELLTTSFPSPVLRHNSGVQSFLTGLSLSIVYGSTDLRFIR